MKHDKRLLVDVFNAYYYKKNAQGNRELVFMSKNLTVGGISNSQETTDVRNGQGNKLFAILPGQKDVTINLTENVFSFEALSVNTGAQITTESVSILSEEKTYKAGSLGSLTNGNVSLGHIPLNPAEVTVFLGETQLAYEAGETPSEAGKFTVDAENLVLHATDEASLPTNAMKILPFLYEVEDAQTLTIKSDEFATGGELWLETIEKDTNQKTTAVIHIVFPNAFPDGNFELSTQSEVQPLDMTINMRAIADENNELYKIIRTAAKKR